MRGSRSKAEQYGGEFTLLYKKETSILNSFVNFAVCLDPLASFLKDLNVLMIKNEK